MPYQNEIQATYQVLLKKADILLNESKEMKDLRHFVGAYSPIHGLHPKDSLFEELSDGEKDLYDYTYDLLRHKTPYNPKIAEETVRTPQIDWLEKQLDETVQGKEIRPIVFLGPKGSGKTTSLNFVISDVNKHFSDKKILVIRGNAEEYCRIKKEFNFANTPMWGIREYMQHHAVNLCVTHRDKEPFKKIIAAISDRKVSPGYPIDKLSHAVRKSIREDGILRAKALIEAIEEQCILLEKSGYPHHESMITYELRKKVSQIEEVGQVPQFHNSWPALWSTLDDYFAEQKIKVFFAFDGLDNVWTFGEEEKRAYGNTIQDLANEIKEYFGNTSPRFFYIVACRPESFQQLNEEINKITNDRCRFRYISEKDTNNTDEIIISKFNNLRNRLLNLQKNKLGKVEKGKFYQALTKNEFTDHLDKLTLDTKLTVPELFGRNTRGVIANFLSFAVFVSFYSQELMNGRMPPQVTAFNIFIRNLFFGGRRLVRTVSWTHDSQWKHSIIFPNIFHFDLTPVKEKGIDISKICNPLLCGVRLLDELVKSSISDKELLKVLASGYKYEELIVKNTVHLFLQFRLIEPVEPEPDQVYCDNELHSLPSARVLRHILNNHIDILTYLAFDTVLPGKVSRWIFHNVDLSKHNQEYLSNTVSVGLKFIAFLNAMSSSEGGSRMLFPIDGHLERTSYLLTELEKVKGKQGVVEILRSLETH